MSVFPFPKFSDRELLKSASNVLLVVLTTLALTGFAFLGDVGLDATNQPPAVAVDASHPLIIAPEILAKGQVLFDDLGCSGCHSPNRGEILAGPDLTQLAKRFDIERLVEEIKEPSKSFAVGFKPVKVLLTNGEMVFGNELQSDETGLTLQMSDGGTLFLSHDRIEDVMEGISDMPEGLLDGLSQDQTESLLQFLMAKKDNRPPERANP